MAECYATVAVGPASRNSGRARRVDVLGQLLVGGSGVWIFTSVPVDRAAVAQTYRLRHGASVTDADVVRVGTALALLDAPEIGDIGGAISDELGDVDPWDITVTARLARLAGPLTDWSLSALVSGGADTRRLADDLTVGQWSVQHAEIAQAVMRTQWDAETG